MDLTFITSNPHKAAHLSRYLGISIAWEKVEVDELQSLDLQKVIEHKAKEAFHFLQKPVLVEDTSLEVSELGRLPGTFIKHFIEELGLEGICKLPMISHSARAKTTFCIYDGMEYIFFTSSLDGTIASSPKGENGFGWDQIFIPNWSTQTSAEMNAENYEIFYRQVKPIDALREYIVNKE